MYIDIFTYICRNALETQAYAMHAAYKNIYFRLVIHEISDILD